MLNFGTYYSMAGAINLNDVRVITGDLVQSTIVYDDHTQVTVNVPVARIMQFIKQAAGEQVKFDE